MKQPISFNGKELPEFVRVTGIELPVTADISALTESIPRVTGLTDLGVKVGGASYKFDFVLVLEKGMDIMQASDEFSSWLRGDNYKESKLVIKEQSDRYVMARVTGATSVKDMFVYGEGSFTMSCSKYIKIENNLSSVKGTGSATVKYTGGLETMPVITLNIPTEKDGLEVHHKQSGKSIKLTGKFNSGSVVKIDTARRVVYLSGHTNMRIVDLQSLWTPLNVGDNLFTVKSKGATASDVGITVDYFRKWS